MEYKEILGLMKEMDNTGLTKLEIEEAGFRLCLEKAAAMPPGTADYAAGTADYAAEADLSQEREESGCKKLVAPMVGTFYVAPAPDQPAFVKVGDKVKKGQTVCIIEAMKLMNEIESEVDGEIVKILVENEEMVEYGQPLFLIKELTQLT